MQLTWANVYLSFRFPQDCSLRGDGQCRPDSQSLGVPLRLPPSLDLSCSPPSNSKNSPKAPPSQPLSCTSALFLLSWQPSQPLTSRTPNHSWPWRFTFSPSPSLLPYIGPALLRRLLSFYVNYSGCRVRLLNVMQSLTHKHTQKISIPCMVNQTKNCILLNLPNLHTGVMTFCRVKGSISLYVGAGGFW